MSLTGLAGRLLPRHARVVASADVAGRLRRVGWPGRMLPAPWQRWTGPAGRHVRRQRVGLGSGSAVVSVSAGPECIVEAGLLHELPRLPGV